jgi:hypothetical protein
MKVGVLALQGDFDAHRRRLEELGAEVVLVRKPEQLDEVDGIGEVRARSIKNGLKRMREQLILEYMV